MGVLRDDGFNVIRSYFPDVWMSIDQHKSYIELVGNYGLRLIDDNNYFFKPPVSNPINVPPSWLINPIYYNQSYNDYDMTDINPTKAIYNYDALYTQVYSILPYKNIIYGHKLCEEPNFFHWYPHANVFPGDWHNPALGDIVLSQWYSRAEVPPQNLSDAFGYFQSNATSLGHKLINSVGRHGTSYTAPDGSGLYNYSQYLNITNKGDVFFEGSYFHWHWTHWTEVTIPLTNGHDYLGKFKNIDFAKTKYNTVFSEMYLSYDTNQYDIRDYSWYTNRNNPNGNLMYFMTYTSIIHGATGVFFYGSGGSYDKEDAADTQLKTLLNDNTATNNNFVIANMPNIYQTIVSNLSQELRYLKELDILSDDQTSVLYTKTTSSDVNGILPSSTKYLPITVLVSNAQDFISYIKNGQAPYSNFTYFTNYHRGEDYGLRYTIRTNGDEVIMIISNPNPYSITENASLDFNSITNPIVANSTGVSVLFETLQTVTSSTYKLDRNWVDRQLFIDNVIGATQDLDIVKCNMQQYSIPFVSTSNKTIDLTFGPFDVKVLKFVGENITANTTWNTDKSIENDVIVETGNTLTISSTIKLMPNVQIIVKKGGKLIIDGGVLTSSCDNLWHGIIVEGNSGATQISESNQGVLEIINEAKVENAEIAIYVGQQDGSSKRGGGIIKIDDGVFLNNKRDIIMEPYEIWSLTTTKPIPQESYIQLSTFKNDQNMILDQHGYGKEQSIALRGITEIDILGNTFINDDNTLSLWDRGTAIFSVNSSLNVTRYCDPQITPCSSTLNTFTNLTYGINVINGFSSNNLVEVSYNSFDNTFRSIFASGTNNAEILSNDIEMGDVLSSYGIYLNGGKGFRVEENNIYRPSTNGEAVLNGSRGIIVHKTGAVNNEIYKNTLTNLFLGDQAQCYNSGTDLPPWFGTNNPGADVGLKSFCNTSQTDASSYDMWMGGMGYCTPNVSTVTGAQRFGIAEFQKNKVKDPSTGIDEYAPAGNRFSDSHLSLPTTATVDFDNGQAGWLEYSWDDLDGNGPDGWEPVREDNVTNINVQAIGDVCPSKIATGGNGNTQTQLYANLSTAQIGLNSSIILLNIWQDGGNANLDEEVETTQPWDVYQQFNSLLAESPYLSDEVLIEVILNPSFTSLMVKLLMIANPHAVRSDAVMYELENRLPAMPQTYIDEIKSQPETTSQLQVLEGNVATDNHLVSTISEDIKRMYRVDNTNTWAKDSLIAFMSRKPGLYDKYELATIYLSYGQYTDMGTVLSFIDNNFELEEELQTDYTSFVSLMTIAQNMQENNLYEEGLSEAQRTSLETVITDDRPLIAPIALALLKRDNPDYEYTEAVYDVPQSSPRLTAPKHNDASDIANPDFKLYPNPARDYTALQYNCQYSNLSYSVIDLSGREIKKGSLKTIESLKTNEVLINLGDLSPGIYYFVVKTNNTSLYTEKLVIAK